MGHVVKDFEADYEAVVRNDLVVVKYGAIKDFYLALVVQLIVILDHGLFTFGC